MQIHNFEQHSDEWYAIRCGRFTASVADTIAVAGAGLETLCFKVAAEILTGRKEETFKSPAMEQGNELEAVARTLFEMKTGYTVEEVGFIEVDDLEGSSPDGLIHIGEELTGVEFKCPQDNTYAKLLFDNKIKPEYYAQMQMQMRHTGFHTRQLSPSSHQWRKLVLVLLPLLRYLSASLQLFSVSLVFSEQK